MVTKSERLEVRLTPEHKMLVERAASLLGQTVSAFVSAELVRRARRVAVEHERTNLTRRDWERFLDVIDRDKDAAPALVDAVRRHTNPE